MGRFTYMFALALTVTTACGAVSSNKDPDAGDDPSDPDAGAAGADAEPGAPDGEPSAADAEPGATDAEPGATDAEPGATDAEPGAPDAGGCDEADCDVHASCAGGPACVCDRGYTGDGTTCADVNECAPGGGHDCSAFASCTNTPGSFTCACLPNYVGDGRTCDPNECALGTDDCESFATCVDLAVGFTCSCQAHAVLLGHDLYASNADVDRLVGNAVLLANTTGVVRVLAWDQYADLTDDEPGNLETANTDAAIRGRAAEQARAVEIVRFGDDTQLAARLPGFHVLLVYEQENTDAITLAGVGASWAAILDDFVQTGGVVVVLDHNFSSGGTWEIASSGGLIAVAGVASNISEQNVSVVAPADRVAEDVSLTYVAADGSVAFDSSDTTAVVEDAAGNPVVLHKAFSPGSCPGSCLVLADFEDGVWPGPAGAPWTRVEDSGRPGAVTAVAAHDGVFGLAGEVDWHYQNAPSFGRPGDVMSTWVWLDVADAGRAYVGFGASAAGARSFVLAPDSGDIRFQRNVGYGYEELAISSQTFVAGTWYRAEVVFGAGGNVTGNLYAADGTTLLNTVSQDYGTEQTGTLTLRSYELHNFDSAQVCYGD